MPIVSSNRLYDICVYGATGFTGRLASLYLATSYPTVLFAISGRDPIKLNKVAAEVNELLLPSSSKVGVFATDDMTLVARSAKIIISTAGPFLSFGEALVEACINEGTHYCNISGEPLFFKLMEERYGEKARAKGVILAMMCGFDSIPADLCTYLAAHKAKEELHVSIESARAYVSMRGSASGGTIATFFNSMRHPQRKREKDPMFLNVSTGNAEGSVSFTSDSVSYPQKSEFASGFMEVPFIMSPINTRIVRRSASYFASLNNTKDRYSPPSKSFEYSEVGLRPSSWKVWMSHIMDSIQFFLLYWIPGFARLAQYYLVPKPGQGPSDEDIIAKNYFHYLVVAKTSEAQPRRVIVKMSGADAGYADTAVMLVESGLCLAFHLKDIREHVQNVGGLHTPATAFGIILVNRLIASKRVKFEYIADTKDAIDLALQSKRVSSLKVTEVGRR